MLRVVLFVCLAVGSMLAKEAGPKKKGPNYTIATVLESGWENYDHSMAVGFVIGRVGLAAPIQETSTYYVGIIQLDGEKYLVNCQTGWRSHCAPLEPEKAYLAERKKKTVWLGEGKTRLEYRIERTVP